MRIRAWGWVGLIMLGLGWPGGAKAQDDAQRSLTEKEGSPASAEQQLKALRESLVLANAEAEFFRRQWQDLRERNEALGTEALTADEKRLEEKLVQAVREMYDADQDRAKAIERLQKLIEASQGVVGTADKLDPQKQADYEAAMREATAYLAQHSIPAVQPGGGLNDGQVLNVRPELGVVILNLGQVQGAKVGMPFRVIEGDLVVGRVKIFQAREYLSAAVIETVEDKKEIKAGDRVSVAAEK